MSEQVEQKIVELAEKFEDFSRQFVVALREVQSQGPPKWYTPKRMFLNMLRVTAVASPLELKVIAVAAHGAIDVLGFSGTLKLVLELRRKSAGKNKGK
jgi:hypothetical protein